MKKRIFGIAAAALLCSVCMFGCAKKTTTGLLREGTYFLTEKSDPAQVNSLYFDGLGGKDVMPVGGFYGPYASGGSANGFLFPQFVTDKYYKLIADAGVNMIVYSKDDDANNMSSILEGLRLGEKYGVGSFVSSSKINALVGRDTEYTAGSPLPIDAKQFTDLLKRYSEYSSFLGIHGVDEPFWYQIDGLEAAYNLFRDTGIGDTQMFTNALGYSVTDTVRGGYRTQISADKYYGALFERVKLPFLSATGYYYTEKDTPDKELSLMFEDLSAMRKLAKRYNVPLWRMLQAGGQWNDAAVEIESVDPYPNEGELLFDVNIALAYGCKAIQYFPLIQPLHFAYAPNGTYDFNRSGIISAAGGITQWYWYVQKANRQIAAIDHVLMNAENAGLIVHGKSAETLAGVGKEGREEILADGKFRQLTKISGDDCFVGCFDYKGGTALYVVNYSRTAKSDVSLTFDGRYGYDVIQRAQSTAVVGERIDLVLEAGEGVLITLR